MNTSDGMYVVNINHKGKNVFSKKIIISRNSIFGASLITMNEDMLEKTIFLIGLFIFLLYVIFLNKTVINKI